MKIHIFYISIALIGAQLFGGFAQAESLDVYVKKLSEHPQVQTVLSDSVAEKEKADGALGLPDPMFMLGVDNLPIGDPSFDKFLPTSKVIGFNQKIPNAKGRKARSSRFLERSDKQEILARYTLSRLEYMLIVKLAEYKRVKNQKSFIKKQLGLYRELERNFKGQIEAGRSVYQRFSEVDVERAEAERKLNNLEAEQATIEAEFVRLVGEVPAIDVPKDIAFNWDGNTSQLYPVLLAKKDTDIAKKDIDIAKAAFLPNFGVNAVYKQREDGQNFSGDDWFSVQAQVSIPLWSSKNQEPKLRAAKHRERSASFKQDDIKRYWVKEMTAIQSARDAASKNVKVLENKSWAMKKKIDASERNYEAGTGELDTVLLAKIDRLNILSRLEQVKSAEVSKSAELASHVSQITEGTK